jgi:hypothetical protein
VKGLNSGSEGVVTVDLVVTLQKPSRGAEARDQNDFAEADPRALVERALKAIPKTMRNPSHVYAAILRDAIKRHYMVDHLHLSDVLIPLRNAGYRIERKSGLLVREAACQR